MVRVPKRWLHALLGLIVAGLFLYLALRKVDPARLWTVLKSVDLRWFFPILLSLVLFFWIKAIRWSYLLKPLRPQRPLTVREILPAQMIGFMANNVLPAHLGEFVRMFVLGKQCGLSKTAVLSTIVLERILDFLAIIGIFAVTLQFVPMNNQLAPVRTAGFVVGVVSLGSFLIFLAFVWRTQAALRVMDRALAVFPHRLRDRAREMIRLGVEGLYSLRDPRTLAGLVLLTLVHWSLNGMGIYLAVVSFMPDHWLSPLAGFFLLSVTALFVTLPSAPGYVGTLQFCFPLALGAFHVEEHETALAGSLYWLFWSYVPVTLAGFYFLARLGLKLNVLFEDTDAAGGNGPSASEVRSEDPHK